MDTESRILMHGFPPKCLCMGIVRLKKDKEIEEEGKQKNVKQRNRGRRLAEKC